MSTLVYSYQQTILVPLPDQHQQLALRAINVANGRAPDAPFALEDICRMSTQSERMLTVDVYSDGKRYIRGAR